MINTRKYYPIPKYVFTIEKAEAAAEVAVATTTAHSIRRSLSILMYITQYNNIWVIKKQNPPSG